MRRLAASDGGSEGGEGGGGEGEGEGGEGGGEGGGGEGGGGEGGGEGGGGEGGGDGGGGEGGGEGSGGDGGGDGGGGEGGGGESGVEVPFTACTVMPKKSASWTGRLDRSDLRRVFWATAGVRECGCLAVPFRLCGSQVSASAFLCTLRGMLRQSVTTTASHSQRKLQGGGREGGEGGLPG